MEPYQGFSKDDIRISQGVHDGDAIDLYAPWGTQFYAPFIKNDPYPRTYLVIRSNRIDKTASNVVYSALQDVITKICFGYFHTGKCTYKEGAKIAAGQAFVTNQPNGKFTGAHLHLVTRYPSFGTKVNPLPYLVIVNGMVKGFPAISPVDPCLDYKKKIAELEAQLAQKDLVIADQTKKLQQIHEISA